MGRVQAAAGILSLTANRLGLTAEMKKHKNNNLDVCFKRNLLDALPVALAGNIVQAELKK
jgi:hypothetical protein